MSDYDSLDGDLVEQGRQRMETYEGGRDSQGERDGHGQATHKNGDEYEGEYVRGLRHGFGKYKFKNKARYEGDYFKSLKEGEGTFVYPDGSIYQGEWKAGNRDGQGKYTYSNGDWYKGSWKHNFKEGLGVYYHSQTQTTYTGMWSAGIRDGSGEVTNSHYSYDGHFEANVPNGMGKMKFKGCQQLGKYVLTDVFVRRNGMLETEQVPTWRCTELIYSPEAKEQPREKAAE